MSTQQTIIVVEDDLDIGRSTTRFLAGSGYRALHAVDGKGLDRLMRDTRPDLIVLDVMLPGEDGLAICRRLRVTSRVPIVMLTALGEEMDRVVGLELGADDYVSKPFSPRELLARVRAVLRRQGDWLGSAVARGTTYGFEGWTVAVATRQVHDPNGVRVVLTGAEFELLVVFCEHPRRVLSRDQLLDLTQGRTAAAFDRSIDTLVSRIRQKIERDPKDPTFILTVRLGGYMFSPETSVS